MRDITLVELLKAGVHFGHQVSRWHPKMRPFIFTSRGGVYVIDLEKTTEQLKKAQAILRELVGNGGVVLLVGTKRQAQSIVQAAALHVGMPYVVKRWLGGTFTNFPTILKVTKRLTHLKQERASGNLEKYTKKEQLEFNEEIARLEKLVGGIERMTKLPEAIFVIDIKQEKTAVREASKVKIPIVAVVDTNVSPEGITYPIPANDDATKSIQLLTDAIVEAIEEGKELAEERLAAQPVTPPPTEASAPPAPKSSSKEIPVVAEVVSDTSEAKA